MNLHALPQEIDRANALLALEDRKRLPLELDFPALRQQRLALRARMRHALECTPVGRNNQPGNPDAMHAKEFRAIREAATMTQMELADWLGIHWRTVQKYEGGETPIPGPVDRAMRSLAAPAPKGKAKP